MADATIVSDSTRAVSSTRSRPRQPLCRHRQSTPTCKTLGGSRRLTIRGETIAVRVCILERERHHQCCTVRMASLWRQPGARSITQTIHHSSIRRPLILPGVPAHRTIAARVRSLRSTRPAAESVVDRRTRLTRRAGIPPSRHIRSHARDTRTSQGTTDRMDTITLRLHTCHLLRRRLRPPRFNQPILMRAQRRIPVDATRPSLPIRTIHPGPSRSAKKASLLLQGIPPRPLGLPAVVAA